MKKKALLAAAVAVAAFGSVASAAPQTQFEAGQWQLDLGAWNTDSKIPNTGDSSDLKWNFTGGLGYAFTDKLALRYDYHGLKTDMDDYETSGGEHEVNLEYSLGKNVAAFAGWNQIRNKGRWVGSPFTGSKRNNIAQIGLITNVPLAKNLSFYALGAVGTQKTSMWEAGLAYTVAKDLDINVGYRYLDTKLTDDDNIKYRGLIAGLSYRFGGGHKAAPAPEPVPEPAPEPVAPVTEPVKPAHVYNDYYLDSIHFASDSDTPLASEQPKLDHFVQVAKEHPDSTFKLIGNTDSDASDAYNEDLSARRVANVAKYAENQGVSSSKLNTEYKGERNPVESNATEQGKADNRRVDIWEHK